MSIRIAALAYADDTVWVGRSKANTESIIATSQEFFCINDIDINGKKSELIVINPQHDPNNIPPQVEMGKTLTTVLSKAPHEETRYLGAHFTATAGNKHNERRVQAEISKFTKLINFKRVSNSHVVYLANVVLTPRLEYILTTCHLPCKTLDILYRPVLKLTKRKCNLPKSFATASITHPYILNLKPLWNTVSAAQESEFIIRINSKDWSNVTTLIRLRCAQNLIHSPTNIFNLSLQALSNVKIQNNFSFAVLVSLKYNNLDVTCSHDFNSWNVPGSGPTLFHSLTTELYSQHGVTTSNLTGRILKSFSKSPLKPFYISQIIDHTGSYLRSWPQIQTLNGCNKKGRPLSGTHN